MESEEKIELAMRRGMAQATDDLAYNLHHGLYEEILKLAGGNTKRVKQKIEEIATALQVEISNEAKSQIRTLLSRTARNIKDATKKK